MTTERQKEMDKNQSFFAPTGEYLLINIELRRGHHIDLTILARCCAFEPGCQLAVSRNFSTRPMKNPCSQANSNQMYLDMNGRPSKRQVGRKLMCHIHFIEHVRDDWSENHPRWSFEPCTYASVLVLSQNECLASVSASA